MDVAALAFSALLLALTLGRIALGIWLFTAPLPLRDGSRWRASAAIACLYVFYAALLVMTTTGAGARSGSAFLLAQFITFSLLLLAFVVAVLAVYDTNVWSALFCCSAGYTVQNLATGATELVCSLLKLSSHASGEPVPARIAVAFACTCVAYGPAYVIITRRNMRTGLGRIDNRSMIGMMVVTILVIIGFDLVIKWLTETGIATSAMVLLRMFHGLACLFTLVMEFELLINSRLAAERNVMEQVLAERERQYEAARENIAAIDARVHDIRHAIGRMASADGLGAGELRELLREVAVYDSRVQTGNEALDTTLTEQRLRFERAGVGLSCIADGTALGFMAPADVYALFSTLLDAVLATGTTSASLVVRETLGSASIHVEHVGAAPSDKGLQPVRDIVARYQGTLTVMERGGASHTNALFPAR